MQASSSLLCTGCLLREKEMAFGELFVDVSMATVSKKKGRAARPLDVKHWCLYFKIF